MDAPAAGNILGLVPVLYPMAIVMERPTTSAADKTASGVPVDTTQAASSTDAGLDVSAKFDRYVRPEMDVMYRTAWSLTRNDADAQDLVQDTLVRAFRSLERFDGRYPRAWLMTIMRNANINRVRKKKPDLLTDPDLTFERSTDFADTDDPETLVVEPQLDAAIEDAFANLSSDFRQVVELVDLNGLAYQEAAEVLDVPVGTVMSRLHRARGRIRSHLEEVGLDSEVG